MNVSVALLSETVRVPVSRRARFVGPGGYNLRRLQAQTGENQLIEQMSQKPNRDCDAFCGSDVTLIKDQIHLPTLRFVFPLQV